MRLLPLLLPLAASFCSALVIPDQEALEPLSQSQLGQNELDKSGTAVNNAVVQGEETDVKPRWATVTARTKDDHEPATDLASRLLSVDPRSDRDVDVSRDGSDDDDGDGHDENPPKHRPGPDPHDKRQCPDCPRPGPGPCPPKAGHREHVYGTRVECVGEGSGFGMFGPGVDCTEEWEEGEGTRG